MDAKLYIKRLPAEISPIRKRWIGHFLSLIEKNDPIFEIGSGVGYDSNYIEKKGHKIIRSDINNVFINHQKKVFNNDVIIFDVLSVPKIFRKKFKAVFANAVLTMFSPYKLDLALMNIKKILYKDGYLVFNLPLEWGIGDIKRYLKAHGYKVLKYYQDKVWFYLIVKKIMKV